MTYQIIITEETAANIIIDNNTTNVSITTNDYPITIEYNAVIEQAGGNAYGNSNVAAFLASSSLSGNIITSANISGAFILGNGSQLTGLPATYGNANVAANLAAFGSNPISTTGNITAGYFVGNGSLLTNITGANVTGTVANATYALNANAATFATTAVQANVANVANSVAGANVSGTVANATYALNSNAATFATQATFATTANAVAGANVSGTVANATYALNSNAATFAGTVTTAAQPNITSVGILTAINTSGNVSATGNITGNYFVGNGSLLTGIATSSYGNAEVAANLAAFATNPISTSGNITAGYFFGNGSQLTGINAGNIVGAYGNANVADFLGNGFGSNTITTTGNITTGNLLTGGLISATGNITGSNIRSAVFQAVNSAGGALRNASGSNQLQWGAGGGDNLSLDVSTNINGANAQINISPTGNSGHVHIKPTGTPSVEIAPTFTGSMNNMIIGNVTPAAVSATTVSATGNINGANLVASANLTSTQQTVVGTANNGSTGNIVMSGKNIATDMAFLPDGGNAATAAYGRVVVGTGWVGNITNSAVQNRLLVQDSFARSNTTTSTQLFASDPIVSLTGNVTNNSFRVQGVGSRVRIGGGSAGNTINVVSPGAGSVGTVAALQPNIDVGNVSPYLLGNTLVSHAVLNGGFFTVHSGGAIGNAYGMVPGMTRSGGGLAVSGNTTNYLGFTNNLNNAGNVTGNLYAFYHGNNSSSSATGIATNDTARAATNYYFLRNDDAVAQVQLGSLRSYNEFRYDTATTGNITVDKNNAQVQYIAPTANVTIDGYANMVTTLSDSVNTDQQIDTLTILVQQGATPYTVTLPTGATYQYAGNISSVPAVANSRSILTVVAANVAGTVNYFTTVQSDQTTQEPAAGANTQVQFNDAGVLGATAGLTFDKTSNVLAVTGNVTTGNLVITPGTGAGNIDLVSSQAYATVTTTNNPARIILGSGYTGNSTSWSVDYDPYSRMRQAGVLVNNRVARGNGAINTTGLTNIFQQEFTANIETATSRNFAAINFLHVGGGASAFQSTVRSPAAFVGQNSFVQAGTNGNVAVGNVTLAAATGGIFGVQVNEGGVIGNAFGTVSSFQPAGATCVYNNIVGFAPWTINVAGSAPTTVPTNYNVFYNPDSSQVYGLLSNQNWARSATNYYAFKNDDDVAQVKLGSLRSYNEFQYSTATTGTVNIDKNNAQVQFLNPTANVTIGDLQNFVTTANDSVNNDNQTDTVTLIIQQGATPYTVTMPTGNASIKYAGGVSTIGATANAVTMVSISAIRSAANATLYLASVSSEFS